MLTEEPVSYSVVTRGELHFEVRELLTQPLQVTDGQIHWRVLMDSSVDHDAIYDEVYTDVAVYHGHHEVALLRR